MSGCGRAARTPEPGTGPMGALSAYMCLGRGRRPVGHIGGEYTGGSERDRTGRPGSARSARNRAMARYE
jgi:hypothetical protein